MNKAVFWTTKENMRKHRKYWTCKTEKGRNYLVSEPYYHNRTFFKENLLPIEMRETQILMNKPVYLRLSILDLSKTVMHECWYDYVKRNYGENVKLCYMDTDSFIFNVKTDDIYKNIAEDVDKDLTRQILK